MRINSKMKSIIENNLEAVATMVGEDINLEEGNNFYINDKNELMNGDIINITNHTEGADEILERSGIAITIFYGDTRYMTNIKNSDGERVIGTQASETVVEKVLEQNQEYFAERVDVVGEDYFAFYKPYYNKDSTEPVGMVFAGVSQENVEKDIRVILSTLMLVAVLIVVIGIIFVMLVAQKISNNLEYGVQALEELSKGNLGVQIKQECLKQKDESGEIARAIQTMRDRLASIVSEIRDRSDQVNGASSKLEEESESTASALSQVEKAVMDMAEGATSQADETQQATENIKAMGEMVKETNHSVGSLQVNAGVMEKQGLHAAEILKQLEGVNDRAKKSIQSIYEQTNNTNESVQKISDAVTLITTIAEETNLLSLNASIEAARAGEQGRGFAVVAAQIQKLAEQSNESAQQIAEIISGLIEDSRQAVETMEQVKEIIQEQDTMVGKTDHIFGSVLKGINESKKGIDAISGTAGRLDEARVNVVDIVQNLSAIAQENAAATQETSASATQVNVTVQDISQNAKELQEIAVALEESIKVFRM